MSKVELITTKDEWTVLRDQATVLVQSGFLPKGIDTPQKAVAIALKGREMGVPIMQSFSHISIINGKPCISSELMLAQIYRMCPGARIEIAQTTENCAIIRAGRPGRQMTQFEFSTNDAKRAGLLSKDTWQKYPKSMYLARCISMMARAMFPDAIMGASYTPEEMGAEVNDDGEIIQEPPLAEELYMATLPQMQVFAKLCTELGVPDKLKMADLSNRLLNAPMLKIRDILTELLAQEVTEVAAE